MRLPMTGPTISVVAGIGYGPCFTQTLPEMFIQCIKLVFWCSGSWTSLPWAPCLCFSRWALPSPSDSKHESEGTRFLLPSLHLLAANMNLRDTFSLGQIS